MTDYEIGRQARREGEPLHANPYWGWFRHAAWERGWLEQERAFAAPTPQYVHAQAGFGLGDKL